MRRLWNDRPVARLREGLWATAAVSKFLDGLGRRRLFFSISPDHRRSFGIVNVKNTRLVDTLYLDAYRVQRVPRGGEHYPTKGGGHPFEVTGRT